MAVAYVLVPFLISLFYLNDRDLFFCPKSLDEHHEIIIDLMCKLMQLYKKRMLILSTFSHERDVSNNSLEIK